MWFITNIFGDPGEKYNGRKGLDFCAERVLCVGNTYLEHKILHKYTRVARSQDGVEVKNMVDLAGVDKERYCAI